jgi:acyl-CoA thioesterase FadM
MRLRFRIIRVILAALFRRKNLYLDDTSVLHFTVMPTDCVFSLVGNDRYHSFMDLGRLDLLIRHGGWHMLLFENMRPFVFATHVRYRLPLKMFQPFVVHTRLTHWSNTAFWMEHVFKSGRKTIATAISKNGFTYKNKVVPTQRIIELLGGEKVSSLYPEQKISAMAAIGRILRDVQAR